MSNAQSPRAEVPMRVVQTIGLVAAATGLSTIVQGSAWTRDVSVPVRDAARHSMLQYEPAAGPRPSIREVTLPAGTRLPIVLEKGVGSDISRLEERVPAHVSRAVRVRGITAVPRGSRVEGVVIDARRSAKVKGRARISLRFDTLAVDGDQRYALRTAAVGRLAPATKKEDALKIGLPAAGGAIVGGLLGGKEGAAIGGAAGGGAGTAVVLTTRGREVRLPRGTAFTLRLTAPLTVRVRE
jgi:hypothetical protein